MCGTQANKEIVKIITIVSVNVVNDRVIVLIIGTDVNRALMHGQIQDSTKLNGIYFKTK